MGIVALFRKPKRRRRQDVRTIRKVWPKPEAKDFFLFGGLGLAAYGVWQIYPPSALIVVGGVFFALGLFWYLGGEAKQ